MKILITGVAGLLGSRLASHIIKNKSNIKVIGIDDLSGGYFSNLNKEIIFYKLNLNKDLDKLKDVFKKHRPDIVYHFAAYAAEGLSPFIRTYNYDNNLKSTAAIVNNCITFSVSRLIFSSSMSVYGRGIGGIFDESHPRQPIDPYAVAKTACELDIEIANEQHNLDYCIIRPHNVYGKNQNIWDKYRNVLGIWMNQIINQKPITIFGDGEQQRAFSYIDDILEPLFLSHHSSEASKQIINLGGIQTVSINEAADILLSITNYKEKIHLESRHEVKHAVPTWEKSVKILNFEHKTTLEEGLIKMWEWARKQPKRESFEWDQFEIEKGIYSFWKNK